MKSPSKTDLIFKFELDFEGSLYCIPMSVRLKLDSCGVKLSLKQWNRIPLEGRRQLLEWPCSEAADVEAYRGLLVGLIEAHTQTEPEFLPVEPAPAWAGEVIPARIIEYSQTRGVTPPDAVQWRALTPLKRFALYKLTRPGHSNDNFLPAMREFGLLADAAPNGVPAQKPH